MRHCFSGPTVHDIHAFHEMLRAFRESHDGLGCGSFGRCGGATVEAEPLRSVFLNGQRIDFHETKEAYFAYVNVRGLGSKALKVQVDSGRLTVVKRGDEEAAGSSTRDASEGKVIGSYELPDDAVVDGIYARVEGGELFLSIPRTPQEPVVEVPIVDADLNDWVDVPSKEDDGEDAAKKQA